MKSSPWQPGWPTLLGPWYVWAILGHLRWPSGSRLAHEALSATWEGGLIRYGADGTATYAIRRMVNGRRWKKALAVRTEREAKIELLRFESDPAGYCGSRTEDAPRPVEPIYLTPDLVERFLTWGQLSKAKGGKGNTRKWISYQKALLAWWAGKLADDNGRMLDLRKVRRADHILPALDGVKGVRHRREVIKALYSWLRKHLGVITAAEDPVMDLPVGQGRVAQTQGGKNKVVSREDVLKVADYLTDEGSRYGHLLTVQAATGWHTTEMSRFVASGSIIDPVPDFLREPGVVAILKVTQHKSGRPHLAKVGERAAFAARILLDENPGLDGLDGRSTGFYRGKGEALGGISERWYYEAVKRACTKLGIKPFSPAWMRHSNATHVRIPAIVSAQIGHRDHADRSS